MFQLRPRTGLGLRKMLRNPSSSFARAPPAPRPPRSARAPWRRRTASRIRRAEVGHPVVPGARDGGGQGVVVVLLGVGEQPAGGKENRDIDALGVHRLELDPGVPAAPVEVPELGEAPEPLALGNHLVVALHRAPEPRDDLAVMHEVQVDEVVRGPDRRPVAEPGVDPALPEIWGFHDVHVAVHDLVAVVRHLRILLCLSVRVVASWSRDASAASALARHVDRPDRAPPAGEHDGIDVAQSGPRIVPGTGDGAIVLHLRMSMQLPIRFRSRSRRAAVRSRLPGLSR